MNKTMASGLLALALGFPLLAEGALANKVRCATVNRRSGKLTLEPGTIDFARTRPDGWKGSAMPHGAVFSNP